MAEAKTSTQFPSQTVSDAVKRTKEYGMEVARGIEHEWFKRYSGTGRFTQNQREFHKRRLYARGEQSIQKYKDEFSVNGDLSYLNLDWTPVPIIPKFVDIVVNGMQDRLFTVKAFAQDPLATEKRTKYVELMQQEMATQGLMAELNGALGVDVREISENQLPGSTEELELHMQLGYKQSIEIAEEQVIENTFQRNKYPELKKRIDYDQTVLGIAAAKHTFNNTDGIKLEYVDPSNLVYSYTEDPNFEDCYYFGEVKRIKSNELKKQFPNISNDDLKSVVEKSTNYKEHDQFNEEADRNTLSVLYFNWKSWEKSVYKIKETSTGAKKAIKKDDTFDPPKDQRTRFEKVAQAREVIYEGVLILGANKLLKWEKASNMVRPSSNINKVMMNYVVSAPRMYNGKIESLVSRMITYADLIQLTHLKLQQVIQRMTPSGVYLDADGLAEIDLGNGTSYNPQEALNLYFQTGSVIGRSMTVEGDMNPGKIPIQELPGGGGQQSALLIQSYNYYLNMIRDVTGLNEARDGSDPDPYALVGVQKLAAANSNTATRHILHSSLYITATLAEAIAIRVKDVLEFHPQRDALVTSIGQFSVGALKEMEDLHLHDFGISLELSPDEEEKSLLENNIQTALSAGLIDLDDAIDIREVKNLKLANQLLKLRRKKKQERDQMMQQQNMQAQAQANAQAQQVAAQAEMQKDQASLQTKTQLEQVKAQLEQARIDKEVEAKMQLMALEFQYNMKLKGLEVDAAKSKISETEDRKDKRTKIQATQQSELIDQRQKNGAPKDFESSGNDILGGGFGLGSFEPR